MRELSTKIYLALSGLEYKTSSESDEPDLIENAYFEKIPFGVRNKHAMVETT